MKNEKKITLDGQKMSHHQINKYAEDNGYYIDWDDIADATELTTATIINPENNQHLIDAIISESDAGYHEAIIQLTDTTQYHDWHDTIRDRVVRILLNHAKYEKDDEEYEKLDDDDIAAYNRQVEQANKYADYSYIHRNSTIEDI